ncbi:MAG: NAD-dependent epimerase/dehydratase family protein [Nitrososphaerota archaeon]
MATLITGGSGFLGRFLVDKLSELDDVIVIDIKEPKKANSKFEFGSITSWPDILKIMNKYEIDSIIHMAADLALKAEKSRLDALKTNFESTFNLLEVAKIFGVKKFIFVSSHAVYGPRSFIGGLTEFSLPDPTTFYGVTKACSEIMGLYYSNKHGLDFRSVRFPVILGPSAAERKFGTSFSSFIDDALLWKKSTLRLPLETKLVCVYYKDAIELLFRLYKKERVNQNIFNCGGIVISIEDLLYALKNKIQFEFEITIDVSEEEKLISSEWTAVAEVAKKMGILEKFNRIEELEWELKYRNLEEIVEDYIKAIVGSQN